MVSILLPVSAGAQGEQAPTTTTTEVPTTTVPTTTTTVPAPDDGADPADPADPGDPTGPDDPADPEDDGTGFTIPEPPERDVPPEDAPSDARPPRDRLIPPPMDLRSLNAVVDTRRQEATAGARMLAEQSAAEAMRTVAARQSELDGFVAKLGAAEARVESRRATERSAVTALERARNRFADLAVEAYTLAAAGGGAMAEASAQAIESLEGFEELVKTSQYSGAAWLSLRRTVAERESSLERAEAETAVAIDAFATLEAAIASARAAVEAAGIELEATIRQGEELIAAAERIGEDLSVEGLGPTILGETILSAEDMATFSARRPNAPSQERLLELAGHFVEEGESEGVRGDIAWAQSILETGNFGYRGSMVSTSDNNFAGIGACDSCSSGFRYRSPQLGVRAQMQLLRAYADDNLTTAQLGNPPVGRAPERVGVRGCCDTWMELSGVWATGPGYGVKILTLYNEMLAHAAARQAAGL